VAEKEGSRVVGGMVILETQFVKPPIGVLDKKKSSP
jgi:hypothetical protein